MNNIKIDDFLKYNFISNLQFSPDGENLAFVVHNINSDNNNYESHIHILNTRTKDEFKLTNFHREADYLWKDDENIIFKSNRSLSDVNRKKNGEKFTSYYKINIKGGEAEKIFEIPFSVNSLKFISEDEVLILVNYDNRDSAFLGKTEAEAKEYLKENKDFEIIEEIPFWENKKGFINKKRSRLYRYNLKTNLALAISDNFTNVYSYELDEKREKVLIISSAYMDKKNTKSSLYVYDLEENQVSKLSETGVFSFNSAHFVGDKILYTGSDNSKFGLNENPKFYTADLNGTNKMQIAHDFDYSFWTSVATDVVYQVGKSVIPSKDKLYFVSTENYSSYLNRIDLSGNIEKITKLTGAITDFAICEDKVYFTGLKEDRLQEIYSVEDETEKLTDLNSENIVDKNFVKPIYHSICKSNYLVEGFILLPPNYDSSKKYPAILSIHGGPKAVFGNVFHHEMQVLANEGYIVFYCNPTGSDGKGDVFSDIRGKYGTVDYEDLYDFTHSILESYPCVDEDRLGLMGGSYGGFMTNWVVGHTNLFKAAVSQRGISNWTSFFGTSDIGYYFGSDQNDATPWTNIEKLWFHSPLKYADKVETPTLFIHSTEDYRCPLEEGVQMFTALKYNGVDSKLVMFRGENHELSRSGKPMARIKRLNEILDWFNKYL